MQGDDIGCAGNFFQRDVLRWAIKPRIQCACGVLASGAQGVAMLHAKSHVAQQLAHAASHVAHTHDAHAAIAALWQHTVLFEQQQGRGHILCHTSRVASRTICPADACLARVPIIYMVKANGGGGHKLHAAAFEQCVVNACTCAHYQGIGRAHIVRTNLRAWQIGGFAQQGSRRADIRNLIVDYEVQLFQLGIRNEE